MSTSEDNKAALRGCFDNASRGRFDALNELLSTDYVLHPEGVRGVEGLTEMVEGYRRALADLKGHDRPPVHRGKLRCDALDRHRQT